MVTAAAAAAAGLNPAAAAGLTHLGAAGPRPAPSQRPGSGRDGRRRRGTGGARCRESLSIRLRRVKNRTRQLSEVGVPERTEIASGRSQNALKMQSRASFVMSHKQSSCLGTHFSSRQVISGRLQNGRPNMGMWHRSPGCMRIGTSCIHPGCAVYTDTPCTSHGHCNNLEF